MLWSSASICLLAMKKILILGWTHPFNVAMDLAQHIAEGFRQNGCIADAVDVRTAQGQARVMDALTEGGLDLILAMSPDGLMLKFGQDYMHKFTNAKLAVLFLDHPLYLIGQFADVLNALPDDAMMLFVDNNQAKQMRRHFDEHLGGRFHTIFFPFGGPRALTHPIDRVPKTTDVTIFATLDQQLYARATDKDDDIDLPEGPLKRAVLERLPRMVQAEFDLEPVAMLGELLGGHLDYSRPEHVHLFKVVDSHLKRHRRFHVAMALLRAARKSGCRVDIYGTGWDAVGQLPSGCQILGARPYGDQFDIFRKSKLVINVDPNWTTGIHDRVFNAMAMQCAVVSNQSQYLEDHFVPQRECLPFGHADEIEGLVDKGLDGWRHLVTRASFKYAAEHTWRSRCANLLGYLYGVDRIPVTLNT